jgi:hypothetical protein
METITGIRSFNPIGIKFYFDMATIAAPRFDRQYTAGWCSAPCTRQTAVVMVFSKSGPAAGLTDAVYAVQEFIA